MKGACRVEHSHRELQASQPFSQACWKGLERVKGRAGGMEGHKLLCQVRTAGPGHGETGCRVRKAECQVLQRHQRRGFYLGGIQVEDVQRAAKEMMLVLC